MSFDFKYSYPQIARESGFKLRQFRDGPLDWRLVASLEVDRILRDQQFEHIDAILLYLSEAPLASMLESNILDSGIAKYFILSQLAVQYLSFCRKFLDETVRSLRESLVHAEDENLNLKRINQEHSNEILHLHKQISQIEVINEVVFPCHICTKNFNSNNALNIHLNKKHSKIQSGEIQCKDDQTLINTIKLELEIKQLKERLNIAEKDIRERVEKRKWSPTEVANTCVTQINAATIDKGTQSNLTESKENDYTGYAKDFGIFCQMQDKISHLEIWQKTHTNGPQQSINEITQKLSEITKYLESRAEQDKENLNKFVNDAISSSVYFTQHLASPSVDELQDILLNTVKNVLHLNSTKLNEILNKIEAICEEKLPSLKVEIQKERLISQQSLQTALSLPVLAVVSASNNNSEQVLENPQEHAIRAQERLLTQEQIETTLPLPVSHSQSSLNNGDQTRNAKEWITPYSKATYSIEQISQEIESDNNETDVSQEILDPEENESGNVSFETMQATHKDTTILKGLTSSVDKKMASYGINSAIKAISASKTSEIIAHLAENRMLLKKIYPRFYATRNKLKQIVDGFTNKQINAQLHRIVSNNNIERPKNSFRLNFIKGEYDINDSFEMHLEEVLNSPIKKPKAYVTNHNNELRKPIPLPRKRVMFHNAERASEVLLPAPQNKA